MKLLVRYLCFCLLTGGYLFVSAQSKRPNIIMILTDDQRWDAMGAMGNPVIQTPHMDRLASEGSLFQNAFVTTPICAASRASIMTGMYERRHGFTFRTPPLQKKFIDASYPKLLKEAGYHIAFFGKFGMQFEDDAQKEIFEAFDNSNTSGYFRLRGPGWKEHVHLTDLTTDKAISFIDGLDDEKPFCVSISYNAPHADDTNPRQFVWPARNDTMYQRAILPEIPLTDAKYFEALPELLKDSLYMGNIRYKWRFDQADKAEEMIKGYYRMISTIDQNLGRLRDFLSQKQLDKETIIIFMGDNGYFLGERRLAGKWLLYENSLRVPLIMYDPRSQARTISDLSLNIDISPTILDLAGVPIPASVQGLSLLPAVRDGVKIDRNAFLCEHLYDIEYIPKTEGIRTQQYKYFRYLGTDVEELYDLEADPLEINNLSQSVKHGNILRNMKQELTELLINMVK